MQMSLYCFNIGDNVKCIYAKSDGYGGTHCALHDTSRAYVMVDRALFPNSVCDKEELRTENLKKQLNPIKMEIK